MICAETRLRICDNSGAKVGYVIHVNGSTGKKTVSIGEVVKLSVKVVEPNLSLKKGSIVSAVIVRVKKPFRRKDGSYVSFQDNAAVLLSDDCSTLMGTRVFGPIPRELLNKFQQIVSLAQEVV